MKSPYKKDRFAAEYRALCQRYGCAVGLKISADDQDRVALARESDSLSGNNVMVEMDDFLDAIEFEVQTFGEFTGDARLHSEE